METDIQKTLDEHAQRLALLDARLQRLETLLGRAGAPDPAPAAPSADLVLEGRLAALERRLQVQRRRQAPVDLGLRPRSALPYADYFVRLAVVCFVLVGALILRVAALDGTIDAKAGTVLGLVYCALLIASSVWQRVWRRVGRHVLVLQLSGTLLAPLVVLETYHKSALLSLPVALALALGVSLATGVHGAIRRDRVLTGVALTAGVVTLFALGISADDLVWRTAATLVLLAAALVVAHRRPWPELRPLVLCPVLVAGGIGGILLAGKSSVPPGTMLILALAAVGTWGLVAASHAVRHSHLQVREAVWLPIVSLWAYGLAVRELDTIAVVAGTAIGTAALLVAAAAVARGSAARVATLGGAASGLLLVAVGAPVLDPWGIAVAAAALLVYGVAVGARSVWLAAASELLVVLASVPVLHQFGELDAEGAPLAAATAGMVAGLLFVHYGWARRTADRLGADEEDELAPLVARALAPASLAWAIIALFGTLRAVAYSLLGPGPALDLTQTLIIAVLAVAALRVGTAHGWRDLRIAGLVGVALLAGKVLMADLPGLEGSPKVVSVVTLGVVSLIVSWTLSRSGARASAAKQQRERAGASGPNRAA